MTRMAPLHPTPRHRAMRAGRPGAGSSIRLAALCALAALAVGGCQGTAAGPRAPEAPVPQTVKPELVVQSGHTINVLDVAYSPDGMLIASASADATVKIWDTRAHRELRTLAGHLGPVYAVAFHPQGTRVASGSMDKTVRIWDLASGREAAKLSGHDSWVRQVAFSPSGDHLVSADLAGNAKLWDLSRKEVVASWKVGNARALAYSPDGKLLAAATEGQGTASCTLWEMPAARPIGTLAVPSAPSALRFDEQGARLAVGTDEGTVTLFDVDKRKELGAVDAHEGYVRTVLFRPGQGTLTTAGDDSVILWDGDLQQRARTFRQASDRIAYSPDGKILATTGANEMSGEMSEILGGSRVVLLWDVDRGTEVARLDALVPVAGSGHISNVVAPFSVAFHPTEPVVATAGLDGLVRLWDLRRGGPPRVLVGHQAPVIALAFNRRGNKLASGEMNAVHVWSVRSGKLRHRLETGGRSLAFDATGNLLVTGDLRGTVTQWNATTGRRMHENAVHNGAVVGMQFLPDNSAFISAGYGDRTIGFWEGSEQLRSTGTVKAHAAFLHSLAISAQRVVAVGGGYSQMMVTSNPTVSQDASITLVRFGDNRVDQLRGHEGNVQALAFSQDGRLLASGASDNTVRLWDTSGARQLAVLEGHTSDVCGVSFSHDDRLLATVGHGGVVRLWDVAKRQTVALLAAFDTESYLMATGDHYYTASKAGLRAVAFRVGMRAVPFEQFDLQLNRPDIVLERLGYASAEVIQTYHRAYRKRLKKMGLEDIEDVHDYGLPQLRLVSEPPPVSTTSRTVGFRVAAEDARHPLHSLLVYVNDVPIHGRSGFDLRDEGSRSVERAVEVTLGRGLNKVQLSVLNSRGAESLKETFRISYQGRESERDLYVLAIGVSRYENEKLNLEYAAKDAQDVAAAFQRKGTRFGRVHVRRILNRDVTKEIVAGAKTFLAQTQVDDQVVVFMAGHGMLDESKDYYFVTADFEVAQPAKRGLSYDTIEGLLDGIGARRKLLLIDTCHSGEVDEDAALGPGTAAAGSLGGGRARAVKRFRGLELWTEAVPTRPESAYGALQETFADLRRGSGAMVISSAGGAEYAVEDDRLQNGAFTYAVLEALEQGRADTDQDGTIRVSELREYVAVRVQELTAGQQHPTSRRENLFDDFAVF